MYAVVSSMTTYAREHRNDVVKLGHSIAYARRLPADFSALLLQQYESFVPGGAAFLWNIPEYADYAAKKGVMRNGEL